MARAVQCLSQVGGRKVLVQSRLVVLLGVEGVAFGFEGLGALERGLLLAGERGGGVVVVFDGVGGGVCCCSCTRRVLSWMQLRPPWQH